MELSQYPYIEDDAVWMEVVLMHEVVPKIYFQYTVYRRTLAFSNINILAADVRDVFAVYVFL